jgi:predicted short-subunit dehydrogenase-like oxidoreductase (DUF2520 family)
MPSKKLKIVLIGAGNMAWHLGHQFKDAGHQIVQVFNRTVENGEELAAELEADFTNRFEGINKQADVYIIAVSDHGIDDIILSLRLDNKIVAHTSGSVPMKGMEHISTQYGIFYPLQTLTKHNRISFKDVPVFVEASNATVKDTLTLLAQSIGTKVHYLSSNQRRAVHVAAVFANNFTNYLYGISHQIMDREKLPFDILLPLLQETLNKAKTNDPRDIQTGPARRGDYKTIEEHLHYLDRNESQREVYLVLTESILTQYRDKKDNEGMEDDLDLPEEDNDFDFDDYDGFEDFEDGHEH